MFCSRNAQFLETDYILDTHRQEVVLDEESSGAVGDVPQVPGSDQLRRSTRVSRPPVRYGYDQDSYLVEALTSEEDPVTYAEAMLDIDSQKWVEAMRAEMDSMETNGVWTLVDPPSGVKAIGCKWIYKRKKGPDGRVETFKARLVAKGYTQKEGIDYEETFSPVAMLKSIRILLAVAAYHDYEIWQMDVKTAFLNGDLTEDIYMQQPQGFIAAGQEHMVCKLNRSIYGLKQSSRSWNIRFDSAVKSFDFEQNPDEPCVYRKYSGDKVTFLVLYVDDILLIGNDVGMLTTVKVWLSQQFSMKDLGEASYILGLRLYRDRSKRIIGLSQSAYIDKIVKRYSMENSKKGNVPFRHGVTLSKKM